MNEKLQTIDFGASTDFGVYIFRVEIPHSRNEPVLIVEDYGYKGQELGIPRKEERVKLKRQIWSKISVSAQKEFNIRLKSKKIPSARWHVGTNLVDRLLGKELCVLAWAAETAILDQVPTICSKWEALRPEERWWLFTMTVSEAGLPEDTSRGWRRALYYALSDNGNKRNKQQRPSEHTYHQLLLYENRRDKK